MSNYQIKFTDIAKASINVGEKDINTEKDVTLFGRLRLNYGKDLNENFLHILENFACPSSNPNAPLLEQAPDTTATTDPNNTIAKLVTPVEGQLWFNTSIISTGEIDGNGSPVTYNGLPFVYDGTRWRPLGDAGSSIAANWGQIADGAVIPAPVNQNGYTFNYSECSWIVSPFNQNDTASYMICRTIGEEPLVQMQYIFEGSSEPVSGISNYLIVGIRGNNNLGETVFPDPPIEPTPEPTQPPSTGEPTTPTPEPETPQININSEIFSSCSTASTSCTANRGLIIGFSYSVSGFASASPPNQWLWEFISNPVDGSSRTIFDSTTSNPTLSVTSSTSFGSGTVRTNRVKVTATNTSTGQWAEAEFDYITTHQRLETSTTTSTEQSTESTPESTPEPTTTTTPLPELEVSFSPPVLFNSFDISNCSNSSGTVQATTSVSIQGGTGQYSLEVIQENISITDDFNNNVQFLSGVNTPNLTVSASINYDNDCLTGDAVGTITVRVRDTVTQQFSDHNISVNLSIQSGML